MNPSTPPTRPKRTRREIRYSLTALLGVVVVALASGSCSDEPGPSTAAPTAQSGEAAPGAVRVARHIDGDSLELDIDGQTVEVRLLGINAPELKDCQGDASAAALADLIDDKALQVSGSDTDRYGRRLVELEVDGTSVNESMVSLGWALADHGDGENYEAAMHAAADSGIGWWASAADGCRAVDPDLGLRIVDGEADPAGRDEEDLNGEYVVLANTGIDDIDLDGWMLRDESTGNRYTFASTTIEAGREITVHTGCGDASGDSVYWCSNNPVWSNQGDTAMLLAPDGAYVAHYFFRS